MGKVPKQLALVLQDREEDRGPVFEVPIYLRDREREAAVHAGEREPQIGRRTVLDAVA